MRRWPIAVGVAALGLAAGIVTLGIARDDPAYWFAASSTVASAALLGAGLALVAGGIAAALRRPRNRAGPLLVAAGFAWFALEWNNPGIGSALAFTLGLAFYASCPPFALHAVFAYPGGRVGRAGTLALAGAYAAFAGLLGILPALFFDPRTAGCAACPDNLLLVADRGSLADDLTRAGLLLGFVAPLALAVLLVARVARSSTGTRPVLAAGALYAVLVPVWVGASGDNGYLANGSVERLAWLGQAGALIGLVLAGAWARWRARHTRAAVARLVVDLAASPPPGTLRDRLALIVGDPHLVLAYPLSDGGRLVDADGRPVALPAALERTTLVGDGRPVAVLGHAPRALDDEQLARDITEAARLALENERLQAEVRARLRELRASRARIVAAGDAERKRLERDLHDGAQQRLVGLSLALRLAVSRLDEKAAAELGEAERELRRASAELRELAHGIFPAVLADEGLAAAIEALAEDGRVPISAHRLPEARLDAAIETAAYSFVAEAARIATGRLTVSAELSGERLVLVVDADGLDGFDLEALEDRVGELDGRIHAERDGDAGLKLRAELPCGS
jgi:signal transduction histidine kinase